MTDYDALPPSIQASITREEWRWTPDKERLVGGFLVPDTEEDLDDDDTA